MQKALKKAFEEFINKGDQARLHSVTCSGARASADRLLLPTAAPLLLLCAAVPDNRVSKLLAKFVNDVLKRGSKLNVKDVESTLDNVVFLYGYIQEKDVFERDYQCKLAAAHSSLRPPVSHRCKLTRPPPLPVCSVPLPPPPHGPLRVRTLGEVHDRKTQDGVSATHSTHVNHLSLPSASASASADVPPSCCVLCLSGGYQWTNKLEGMFKDVQLSKDMMLQFRKLNDSGATVGKKEVDEVQLEVNVCTTGYWPSSKVIPCKMPRDLSSACDKYKRFYLNQHSGHKLEWRFDQGQGELVVDFAPQCRKGLVLSTYQMMILLVFNTVKRVTYKEVLDMTGIPRFEIANHLLSLCHPKVNVVLKRPNNKKLEDSHQFMLNAQYKNALKKVNVPLLRAVEAEDTGEEENKAIELQRRHQMDAAIVRIMKTRKNLRHNLLVAEVIQQLSARFKPKPNDIKKRIEALIEQDYMERDKEDRGVYSYLA